MAHWRKMFDERFVGAWDLEDGDKTVTIERTGQEKVHGTDGDEMRPAVYFKGAKKAMVLNKTNAKAIAALYGNDVEGWIGKRITLTSAMVSAFGETTEAVRVVPRVPAPAKAKPTETEGGEA